MAMGWAELVMLSKQKSRKGVAISSSEKGCLKIIASNKRSFVALEVRIASAIMSCFLLFSRSRPALLKWLIIQATFSATLVSSSYKSWKNSPNSRSSKEDWAIEAKSLTSSSCILFINRLRKSILLKQQGQKTWLPTDLYPFLSTMLFPCSYKKKNDSFTDHESV